MIVIKLTCEKHPEYKAIRQPQYCEACETMFYITHGDDLSAEDLKVEIIREDKNA